MSSYNDWEADLSSIIEKTNQNLKLLRRIGDKRADFAGAYDVSTTTPSAARPSSGGAGAGSSASAAQIASDLRSFAANISSRYASEDLAAASGPHVRSRSATMSGRKLHRSSSTGASAGSGSSVVIRPAVATTSAFDYDSGDHADTSGGGADRSPRSKNNKRGSTTTASRHKSIAVKEDAVEDIRKSLEVDIASRAGAMEKKLADLRTDFSVLTSETTTLAQRFNDLRDTVLSKVNSVPSALQSVQDACESISRLEKHSAVLLGWKVSVDQDLVEVT
ncbi:hypothetical protein PINS_up004867 [Pythium insidiosum]|nr:hypothetical protein PINS_up004867 [Pythium insidiosum]